MGDKGKIAIGLAIFVIFVTFPFWGRLIASGEAQLTRPELEYPADVAGCVEECRPIALVACADVRPGFDK